jgi:hypothetical protein
MWGSSDDMNAQQCDKHGDFLTTNEWSQSTMLISVFQPVMPQKLASHATIVLGVEMIYSTRKHEVGIFSF